MSPINFNIEPRRELPVDLDAGSCVFVVSSSFSHLNPTTDCRVESTDKIDEDYCCCFLMFGPMFKYLSQWKELIDDSHACSESRLIASSIFMQI